MLSQLEEGVQILCGTTPSTRSRLTVFQLLPRHGTRAFEVSLEGPKQKNPTSEEIGFLDLLCRASCAAEAGSLLSSAEDHSSKISGLRPSQALARLIAWRPTLYSPLALIVATTQFWAMSPKRPVAPSVWFRLR